MIPFVALLIGASTLVGLVWWWRGAPLRLLAKQRTEYRQSTIAVANWILILTPWHVRQAFFARPGIIDDVDRARTEHRSPTEHGTTIAAVFLQGYCEGLTQADRQEVASQLRDAPDTDVFANLVMVLTSLPGAAARQLLWQVTEGSGASDMSIAKTLRDHAQKAAPTSVDSAHRDAVLWADHAVGDMRRQGEIEDASVQLVVEVAVRVLFELPPLSGVDIEVKLASTATGIILIEESTGHQITERRALTQDDLQKVPLDAEGYTFVNLHAADDELVSCLFTSPDSQVYGSMRAFWWLLAKNKVIRIDEMVRGTRMTPAVVGRVFAEARSMWDTAVEKAGSIDDMRGNIVPLRDVHFRVITQLIEAESDEAGKLGLEIAGAMVLATQSEDPILERCAYEPFRRFLWQPGEEPEEFETLRSGLSRP